MFLKHVKTVLDKHIDGEGEGWRIVDVFGGSGLLSHTAKQLKQRQPEFITILMATQSD